MKRGTYAEARNAGFSDSEAGFLSRFGAEIRDEAVEEIRKDRIERISLAGAYAGRVAIGIIAAGMLVGLGIVIGRAI